MKSPIFSVGVDLGGTWVRLEAVDARGRSMKSLKAPSVPVDRLHALLKKQIPRWAPQLSHLFVASRGIWTAAERARLKSQLRGLAKNSQVMSDVEAAWHAAFSKGAGIVLIAGTGSIVYGRDRKGHSKRAGGLGPALGDEGSAFWIGKNWLTWKYPKKPVGKLSHALVRRVAALAPTVVGQARRGDRLASAIVQAGQEHLAAQLAEVVKALRLKQPIPVSWGGALMDTAFYRSGFWKRLKERGIRFKSVVPGTNAALAIARLAL